MSSFFVLVLVWPIRFQEVLIVVLAILFAPIFIPCFEPVGLLFTNFGGICTSFSLHSTAYISSLSLPVVTWHQWHVALICSKEKKLYNWSRLSLAISAMFIWSWTLACEKVVQILTPLCSRLNNEHFEIMLFLRTADNGETVVVGIHAVATNLTTVLLQLWLMTDFQDIHN